MVNFTLFSVLNRDILLTQFSLRLKLSHYKQKRPYTSLVISLYVIFSVYISWEFVILKHNKSLKPLLLNLRQSLSSWSLYNQWMMLALFSAIRQSETPSLSLYWCFLLSDCMCVLFLFRRGNLPVKLDHTLYLM